MSKEDQILELLKSMNQKIDNLESRLDNLEARLDNLEAKFNKQFNELYEKVESINRSLILIQNKVYDENPALFDGVSFNQQHIKKNDEQIDFLENVVSDHAIRISKIEYDFKIQAEQIKNLIPKQ